MNIIPQINPKEFEEFLFNKICLNSFEHKFLNDYIESAKRGEKKLFDKSLINYTENGWILILHGEILMVYGENWSSTQFEEIKKVIDLNQFKNFVIHGNSQIITELLNFFRIENYSIVKERIFYKTKTINNFTNKNLKIELGNFTDLNELSLMLQQYYHEEYKGENEKSINEMKQRILQVIYTNKIYILKNSNDDILSFCTIINPDIGILFTKREHRKKGYGKHLLSFCSNLLLKENGEVFVMTDKQEIPSNKTCTVVGFNSYYNHSMVNINCC